MGMVQQYISGHNGGIFGRAKGEAHWDSLADQNGKRFIPALGAKITFEQMKEGARKGLGTIAEGTLQEAASKAGNAGQRSLIENYLGQGSFVSAARAGALDGDAESVLAALGPHPEAIDQIIREAAERINSHF